jgi:hypothetical protein|tara:strand:+ start:8383 stop:8907 length:525 start_codon:yes stop_codon:yes gene_type:complete
MALDKKRLVRNIAKIENDKTAKNTFLKTKPKIQEMKENVEEASKLANAIHDYVARAEVEQVGDGGFKTLPGGIRIPQPGNRNSLKITPLIEKNSLQWIADDIQQLLGILAPTIQQQAALDNMKQGLELGIVTTNAGIRYLTTRRRASQLGGSFQPVSDNLAKELKKNAGKGRLK